jgi:hypothetical protein
MTYGRSKRRERERKNAGEAGLRRLLWRIMATEMVGKDEDCADWGDTVRRKMNSFLEAGPEGNSISEPDEGSMNHLYTNNSFFCGN